MSREQALVRKRPKRLPRDLDAAAQVSDQLAHGHPSPGEHVLHGGELVLAQGLERLLPNAVGEGVFPPQHARRDAVLERQLHRGVVGLLEDRLVQEEARHLVVDALDPRTRRTPGTRG